LLGHSLTGATMIDSKKTARNQLPKIRHALSVLNFGEVTKPRVFDLGCGKPAKFQQWCEDNGFAYFGYDPHNQPRLTNEVCLELLKRHPPHVTTISNVLNVIKDREERISVLKQAREMMRNGGYVVITVYAGDGSSQAGETRDGWQNRMPLESYLDECREVFGDVTIQHSNGVKFIKCIVWLDETLK